MQFIVWKPDRLVDSRGDEISVTWQFSFSDIMELSVFQSWFAEVLEIVSEYFVMAGATFILFYLIANKINPNRD